MTASATGKGATKAAAPVRKTAAKPRRSVSGGEDHVGNALRSVFEQTVDESIPPEMLDLLGKLA